MYNGKIIIDCGGLDLTETSDTQKISGLYVKLSSALTKNVDILLSGCLYGEGMTLAPFNALICQATSYLILVIVSKIRIEISNDDTVKIEEIIS